MFVSLKSAYTAYESVTCKIPIMEILANSLQDLQTLNKPRVRYMNLISMSKRQSKDLKVNPLRILFLSVTYANMDRHLSVTPVENFHEHWSVKLKSA